MMKCNRRVPNGKFKNNKPLDQSAAYILGLFQKKNCVLGPLGGNEEDLRGTKKTKTAPKFGALFWGPILL